MTRKKKAQPASVAEKVPVRSKHRGDDGKLDLEELARSLGAIGTCTNCGRKNRPIVMFLGNRLYCVPCRNKAVSEFPPLPDP
ncbi:MAG: hypothetical protein MIO87_01260, partial [Methanomassiliicoccales archaeon]|nr:hypothetical protein [Methanomassiliicoccales archaeon]